MQKSQPLKNADAFLNQATTRIRTGSSHPANGAESHTAPTQQHSESLTSNSMSTSTETTQSTASHGLLSDRTMENLWDKMIAMFGHKWASTYGPTDSGDTWRKVLTGITPRQLADGLNRLATQGDAWPPSAPEFRKMCLASRDDALGIPAPEIALLEAMTNASRPGQHKWTHGAIYVAGKATGWYELKTSTEQNRGLVERFKRNYEIASNRVINGEDLNAEIPLALEDTRNKPRQPTEKDREAGAAALAALRGQINV